MGARGNRRPRGSRPLSLDVVRVSGESARLVQEKPTGGSGEYAAVCLDDGQELIVAIQLQIRDVRTRTPVDDQFVQDFELLSLLHFAVVRRAFARAIYRARESHAQVHPHTLLSQHPIEVLLILCELEVRQETQTTETETEDWWDDALKEPRGKENGAVTAEGEDEIELLRRCPAQVRRPVFEHLLISGILV